MDRIYSYGILLVNSRDQVLMIQRRYSMEFIDIISGKYPDDDKAFLAYYCSLLTHDEKNKLMYENFNTLWDSLWSDPRVAYQNYFLTSRKRFMRTDFRALLGAVTTQFETPEYGFPKGRRKPMETVLDCALREFVEETQIPVTDIVVRGETLEETFVGTNGLPYGTKYFVADYTGPSSAALFAGNNEVGKLGFFSIAQGLSLLRDYRSTTRHVLFQLQKLIHARRAVVKQNVHIRLNHLREIN